MKKFYVLAIAILCSFSMWADQNWEPVHMFVVPQALWTEWSDNYTLKVALKRWNGSDDDEDNWNTYTFHKCDAVYDNKAVYFGDVWICWGGFAQMAFDAYNGDTKVLDSYTFWPPETGGTDHWIEKAAFENKVFYGWNSDYLADFPFINSIEGKRIWFDNSASQWDKVYVRIGRDALTGAGNYAATWPMTRVGETNLWYVDVKNWDNALVWTIIDTDDNNGDGNSVYNIPNGANRLYFFNYSIAEDIYYIADGEAAEGTDGTGVNYWASHRKTDELPTGIQTTWMNQNVSKTLRNGQLVIEKLGVRYNILGTEVK